MNISGFLSDTVTSKDNPSVKRFRKLMTSKKERFHNRLFALEGSRLVFDALKNNAPVKTQGIFAECAFIDKTDKLSSLKKRGRYAVLYQLQDPGNAGMIIRTADALGLDGVIFTESCDIYNPKVVRSTMGSIFRIPVYRDIPADDVFAAMDSAEINTYAAVVDRDAVDIKTVDFRNGGGIVIGNEGNGLPEEIILKCTQRITIKMNGNIDSLNAAMATGIIMWELMKFE